MHNENVIVSMKTERRELNTTGSKSIKNITTAGVNSPLVKTVIETQYYE